MFSLQNDTQLFINCVKSKQSVVCNSQGLWYCEGCIKRFIRKIFPWLESSRIANVAKQLSICFDKLEEVRVSFTSQGNLDSEFVKKYRPELFLSASEALLTNLSSNCCSDKVVKELSHLKDRIVSLSYRLEYHKPLSHDDALYAQVQSLAEKWKKSQLLAPQELPLNEKDIEKLREASRYPLFCKILLENSDIREKFFKWTIRYGLATDVFIEFAHSRDLIRENHMQGRLAYYDGTGMRLSGKNDIQRNSEGEFLKDLQLKFETEDERDNWISILDKTQQITLKLKYKLTIQEMLNDFGAKNVSWGKIEMTANGIANWNVAELARWNGNKFVHINTDKERWWEQLPPVKRLSFAEAQKCYGSIANGINWLERSIATRKSDRPILPGAHAFEMVAIPNGEGYDIHTFGKSTKEDGLPTNNFEKAIAIAKTMSGAVISPDVSIFETRRQFGGSVHGISPNEGLSKMEKIKKDIIRAFNDNFPYQVFVSNCAMAVRKWRTYGHNDLFQASFDDCVPPTPLDKLHYGVKKTPLWFQDKFFKFFFSLLGGWRGRYKNYGSRKKYISVVHMKPWTWHHSSSNKKTFCIPSLDHRLFSEGNLHRVFKPST